MKIIGPNRTGSAGAARPGRKAKAGASFSLPETGPTAPVAGPRPIASVGALLALQAVPDATTGRARAVRRGDELLDMLDTVRLGVIAGVVPGAHLERLARLVESRGEAIADRALAEVIAEIELRARVELAKLEKMAA